MNVSAARSFREAMPELLTLHRLNITGDLYSTLHSTNGIENLFSSVRHRGHNVKNYRQKQLTRKAKQHRKLKLHESGF